MEEIGSKREPMVCWPVMVEEEMIALPVTGPAISSPPKYASAFELMSDNVYVV